MTGAFALLVVHVAGTATWFGVPLSHGKRVRLALEDAGSSPGPAAKAMAVVHKEGAIALAGGALTILSGIGLIVAEGGMAVVPKTIHAALGLGILLFALTLAFRGKVGQAAAATAAKNVVDARSAGEALAPVAGVMQLVWIVILGLMFWPRA